MLARTSLFVTAWLIIVASLSAAQTLPKPTGRVNDFADLIDAATEAEIDRRLAQLEQQTSSEIAVATVHSLDGMPVDEYANRLFQAWSVGRANEDNGVLVVVAPNEREMRIEVGYGLEGVLPDGLAGQIIREQFTPRFRENDYAGGIRDGVYRIADVVGKQQVLTPEQIAALDDHAGDGVPEWILIPFFGLFVTIGFGMVGLGVRTKTGFPLSFGSFFGGLPLLMSLLFVPAVAAVTLVPLALFIAIVGYRLGARPSWRNAFRDGGGGKGGSSTGWTMGTSGSGRSGGSSGSSSSFGGGSSGGGGASGRW